MSLNWFSTALRATCICRRISLLKCPNCPYETLSPITPLFSHSSSVSLWVTVARLQPRPERLAVWVTAPHSLLPLPSSPTPNTFIQRSSDYFSSFIWTTKHSPTPNLALCWKGEPSWREQSRGGCWKEGVWRWAPVGSVVSVWTLHKREELVLLACGKRGKGMR